MRPLECSRHHTNDMPNSPAPDRVVLSVRIPRELMYKLEKLASSKKESTTDIICNLLDEATSRISLSPVEDASPNSIFLQPSAHS